MPQNTLHCAKRLRCINGCFKRLLYLRTDDITLSVIQKRLLYLRTDDITLSVIQKRLFYLRTDDITLSVIQKLSFTVDKNR